VQARQLRVAIWRAAAGAWHIRLYVR
jgi:hypothetical protein